MSAQQAALGMGGMSMGLPMHMHGSHPLGHMQGAGAGFMPPPAHPAPCRVRCG